MDIGIPGDRDRDLLVVEGVRKHFRVKQPGGLLRSRKATLKAVDGISLELAPGETLGIVGESGCGKSTLARLMMGMLKPDEGSITVQGADLTAMDTRERARHIQMVFQNPFSSLSPRMRVGESVAEPLLVHGIGDAAKRRNETAGLFRRVGLTEADMRKYPHQFSGGQRQRIAIARALALKPPIVVCDEPVSALDVSVQAQVLELLTHLQRESGLSYVFISHDLSVVRMISDRVAVMYLGRIVEEGSAEDLFRRPRHPYTRVLIDSAPVADPMEREKKLHGKRLAGELPSAIEPPSGCSFRTRCPKAAERCSAELPLLAGVAGDHRWACHFPE